MKGSRWLWIALMLLAVLTAVAACAGGEEKKAPAAGAAPPQAKVRLVLDWFPNANHAGLYLALEKGYFTEEGLEVTAYTPQDPATILSTVGSGKDDFGFEYQVGVLLARGQSIPVISLAGVVQHPLNSVMALKESGITRPRELAGKKVGYGGIATDPPLLRAMLTSEGLSKEQVDATVEGMVNVGYDLVPALISKRVDAIIGAYWTHESISAQNQGFPVNIMRLEQWGVPDFYELVLVTNEKMLAERPDTVQRFVRALVRGYQEAARDPQGAIDIVKKHNPEIDEKIDRPGVDLLAPLWTEGVPTFGWQTTEKWAGFARWMQANGLLKGDVDPNKAFTNRFVEAAKK